MKFPNLAPQHPVRGKLIAQAAAGKLGVGTRQLLPHHGAVLEQDHEAAMSAEQTLMADR